MDNDEIQEMGSKVDVSRDDIKQIKKSRFFEKWFDPALGSIVFLFSIFFGFFIPSGISTCNSGYPLAVPSFALSKNKTKIAATVFIAALVGGTIGFLWGLPNRYIFCTVYGYNVYKR